MIPTEHEYQVLDLVTDLIHKMQRDLDRSSETFLAEFRTLMKLDTVIYTKKLECLDRECYN